MKLAKATKEDCQKVWDLYRLIKELSEECEHDSTREKLEHAINKAHQGIIGRVVCGMETCLDNDIFDPNQQNLTINPRFEKLEYEPTELW